MRQPLSGEAMPLDKAVEAVRTLALGSYVRRLPSGTGRSALPPDVEVQYLRLLSGGGEEELTHGAHLFVGDRLWCGSPTEAVSAASSPCSTSV